MITTIKKLAILLFVFGTSINFMYADDEDDLKNFYNSLLPDFQKMTPEASALGQYGTYSASGNTGVPNISVPLFSIGSGSFSMPFDLNYDASGIKVAQDATYVGLGWNLNVGGCITQIVCGQNDFVEKSCTCNSYSNSDLLQTVLPYVGYIAYPINHVPQVEFPAVPTDGYCFPVEKDKDKFYLLTDVTKGSGVPDIFQASFCGHNVSFSIDKQNKSAKIISNDAANYKIVLNDYKSCYPHSIEITDDHGIKYLFNEAIETSMESNVTYKLSKITNNVGLILAEFKYKTVTYNAFQPYYETVGKQDASYNKPIASDAIIKQFIDRNYPTNLIYPIKKYYPDTIKTQREIVVFSYGDRDDIKNTKRLWTIEVKSINNPSSVIHRVYFSHDYFTENSATLDTKISYGYNSYYGYKRLKLATVNVDGKNYSFDYYTGQLPTRLSTNQDFWGYYNGQNNKDGFCASPEFKYNNDGVLEGLETVGPANRYASEAYCKIGVLTKITYPTGGYSKFDYEINHFNDVNEKYYYPSASAASPTSSTTRYIRTVSCGSGYTYTGSGLGYKTTPDTQEFDVNQDNTEVTIKSSSPYYPSNDKYYKLYLSLVSKDSNGKIIFSKYYTKYNHQEDFSESCTLKKGHYTLSSQFENVISGLIIGGSIQISFPPEYREETSIADASGKSIGAGLRIKKIENYDSDGAILGHTLYKYDGGKLLIPTVKKETINMQYLYKTTAANPSIYVIPSTFDCRFFFVSSNSAYPTICSLGTPDIGYSKIIKENYDKYGQMTSYDVDTYHNEGYEETDNSYYFNMFSVNLDGLNGKLTESLRYSPNKVLMHKTTYSYTTFGNNPAMSNIVLYPWARCLSQSPGATSLVVDYKYSLYPKYPIVVLPSAMTETNYVNGSQMSPVTTNYCYKESNFQPTKITKTFPNNDVDSTKFWYPGDSEVNSCNTSYLTNAHCISEKVKALEYRDGSLAGGYRNLYGTLTNGLPVILQNFSIATDGSERCELSNITYDNYGNICGYTKNDGTPVAIIWSYNHQRPVMEIVGMSYSDAKKTCSSLTALENMITVPTNMTKSLHASLIKNNIMVTAYEYSPWLTVSRIIKPNGYAVDYAYNSHGRLMKSSDASGTIQKYEYNYKQ